MIDSEQVPWGNGEKQPGEGDEIEPETIRLQGPRARSVRFTEEEFGLGCSSTRRMPPQTGGDWWCKSTHPHQILKSRQRSFWFFASSVKRIPCNRVPIEEWANDLICIARLNPFMDAVVAKASLNRALAYCFTQYAQVVQIRPEAKASLPWAGWTRAKARGRSELVNCAKFSDDLG